MKLFISWSGDFSKEVAEKLKIWIKSVIQSVDVFLSQDDIGKGENWDRRLSRELAACDFGIVCLTPENVAAPWIHFEAGSLAKSLDAKLSSIMLGVSTSDIKGPLSRFQNTTFSRDDFYKLMQSINSSTEKPLSSEILQFSFDIFWPRLESDIIQIIDKYKIPKESKDIKKSDSEAMQEILQIVRKFDSLQSYLLRYIKDVDTRLMVFQNSPASFQDPSTAGPLGSKWQLYDQVHFSDNGDPRDTFDQ